MRNMTIRKETPNDHEQVRKILALAFGRENEGRLVERLRKSPRFVPELSLVAEIGDEIIGHILFFPIAVKSDGPQHSSLALAPVSVVPEYQGKGIGSQLITEGLKRAKELGYQSVIVPGHPEYYPKFGFKPASEWNIRAPFEVPDEAFLAIELEEDGLRGVSGTVEYPDEFNDV